jgi:hypothetical protein
MLIPLITDGHLQNVARFRFVLLFFSVIICILLMQSTYKADISSGYYLTDQIWYGKEDLLFNKYQFVQAAYAQGDEETAPTAPTLVSNATNEEAIHTPSAIRQADTTITIVSLIISLGIVSGIFIFVN